MNDNTAARKRTINGLRALADFLETHSDVPVDGHSEHISFYPHHDNDTDERAEIDRIADALGVKPTGTRDGDFYRAEKRFGPISYKAISISSAWNAAYDARHSYDNAITL